VKDKGQGPRAKGGDAGETRTMSGSRASVETPRSRSRRSSSRIDGGAVPASAGCTRNESWQPRERGSAGVTMATLHRRAPPAAGGAVRPLVRGRGRVRVRVR